MGHFSIGGLEMRILGARIRFGSIGTISGCLILMAGAAHAQAVGNAAPVPEKQGLLGTYYSFPSNSPTTLTTTNGHTGPGSTMTSVMAPPPPTGIALLGEQLDPNINFNFQTTAPPLNANNPGGATDWFMVEWTGRLVIPAAGGGAYTFYATSDDGERTWVGNTTSTTPTLDYWQQRAAPAFPGETSAVQNLTAGNIDFRCEYEQGNGGTTIQVSWSGPPAATATVIPAASFLPPPGPAAPTLTAVSPLNLTTPTVNLSWNQPTGATGYILARQNPGGTMTVIAIINSGATTTYTDTAGLAFGSTYNYIIQATSHTSICIGPASATVPCTPLLPAVVALPNMGLQTNENGATANFTITYTQVAPAGGSVLTVTTSDVTEGVPSSPGLASTPVTNGGGQVIGFTFTVPAGQKPVINVVVTGIDDNIVDGPIPYQINVAATGFTGPTTPPVQCINQDNDIAGITYSQTSGIVTSENGSQAFFTVVLNKQPFGNVSWTLTSSNTGEGTVLPGSLTFTTSNWSTPQTVTVTGVDDTVLDFTQPYQIVPGPLTFSDPQDQAAFNAAGVTTAPTVYCENLDNEVPPALPTVWGSGCGLMGMEIAVPWLLALGLRRRRRGNK
jgi:hypothetical protein